jgi:hypothetical protein
MTEETAKRNRAGRRRDLVLGTVIIALALALGFYAFGNKQEANLQEAGKNSLADQVTQLCLLDDEASRLLRAKFPALCNEAAQASPEPAARPAITVVPGPTVVVTSVVPPPPPIVIPAQTITVQEPPIVVTGPSGQPGVTGPAGPPGEHTTATVTTTPPTTTVTETSTSTLPPPDTTTSQPTPSSPLPSPDLGLVIGLVGIAPPRRWM